MPAQLRRTRCAVWRSRAPCCVPVACAAFLCLWHRWRRWPVENRHKRKTAAKTFAAFRCGLWPVAAFFAFRLWPVASASAAACGGLCLCVPFVMWWRPVCFGVSLRRWPVACAAFRFGTAAACFGGVSPPLRPVPFSLRPKLHYYRAKNGTPHGGGVPVVAFMRRRHRRPLLRRLPVPVRPLRWRRRHFRRRPVRRRPVFCLQNGGGVPVLRWRRWPLPLHRRQ